MEDLSLHILDIAENSISAGATIVTISLIEDSNNELLTVEVEDNGKGIPDDLLKKVIDPFHTSRTTRKVGLGLPFLAQSAKETGGDISLESKKDSGTIVTARFRLNHIDMKPLGNIEETLVVLIAGNPVIDIVFSYTKNGKHFILDTRQLKLDLEGIPINSPPVISTVRNHIKESLKAFKQ
jgi:anti-sigma regulatory factor (Ser/Thr protein kinase)